MGRQPTTSKGYTMKLSYNWLGEYIDTAGISPADYAARMTDTGSKVEGYALLGEGIQNVVVGRVAAMERHPNADKLWLCKLDVGTGELLNIVTGADNVTVGTLVPVAVAPATLPGGVEIKAGKLRGEVSEGMLCSVSELELPDGYVCDDGTGILLLEEGEVGQDIRDLLCLSDTAVEFEITSNRPDCLGMVGLARESAASFERELKLPDTGTFAAENGEIDSLLSVEIHAPQLCPRYAARVVKNVKIAPSPMWLKSRLRTAGVRPINNIVDITNYVMLEFGQPMHAFDYDRIGGGKIIVREAAEGEVFSPIVGEEDITLTAGMTVIADATKPVALAGVMGGANSEITEATTTIVFESANFSGPATRSTSRKLSMRSESSGRFEKGLDPETVGAALNRAVQLILELGAGTPVSGIIDVYPGKETSRTMPFDPKTVNALLGTELSAEYMSGVLSSLGFGVSGSEITIPSWRGDVTMSADIAEEVARIYGYNNIPSTMFRSPAKTGLLTDEQAFRRLIQDTMVRAGAYEVKTMPFVSPKSHERAGLKTDPDHFMTLLNPLGEDTSVMRRSLLPSLLECLEKNHHANGENVPLFELANVYLPQGEDELPTEKMQLVFGFCGGDFYKLKGICETLLAAAGVTGAEFVRSEDCCPALHPGRNAYINILGNGQWGEIGSIGEIHPSVAKNYDISERIYVGTISFDSLFRVRRLNKKYAPLPKYPAMTRDFSLLCDTSIESAAVERIMRRVGGELVETVRLFDVYIGKGVPEGKKSMAFSVAMRAADRTLTDEEAGEVTKAILAAASAELGASLRG